jgi:hypothetical protein
MKADDRHFILVARPASHLADPPSKLLVIVSHQAAPPSVSVCHTYFPCQGPVLDSLLVMAMPVDELQVPSSPPSALRERLAVIEFCQILSP